MTTLDLTCAEMNITALAEEGLNETLNLLANVQDTHPSSSIKKLTMSLAAM